MNSNRKSLLFGMNMSGIIRELLVQWKAFLVVCIITAIILPAVKYTKDVRLYNTQRSQVADDEIAPANATGRINEILSNLSDKDKMAVEQVVRQGDWLKDKSQYMNESILMSLDPYNVKTISLGFRIEGVDNEFLMDGLLKSYRSAFDDNEKLSRLTSVINADKDNRFIRELISFEIDETKDYELYQGDTLHVSISVPDGCEETAISDAAKLIVEQRYKELSETNPHTISLIYEDIQNEVNQDLIEKKNNIINWITNVQEIQNNSVATLTESQSIAYSEIMRLRAIETSIGETYNAEDVIDSAVKPGFSKKFVILGFLFGIIVYLFIFFAYELVSNKISSVENAEELTDLKAIGTVCVNNQVQSGYKKMLVSNAVERLIIRKHPKVEAQTEKISCTLKALCKRKRLENLAVIDITSGNSRCSDLLADICSNVQENNIFIDIVVGRDDLSEEDILNVNNAVISVSSHTKEWELVEVRRICDLCAINLLGLIYFDII